MNPEAAATLVVQHALSRRTTLRAARLVCLDGPSGSGKTTLAAAIADRVPCTVLHLDEMFAGWDGILDIPRVVPALLRPMAAGRDGWWQRWDYAVGRWAEWHRVRAGGLVVLDGVGSGGRAWAGLVTTLVHVEAPRGLRLARGLARADGMDENWRRWQVREDALLVRERTRARADLVVLNP